MIKKKDLHIQDDYKPLIRYIHKKDKCRSSFRRDFSRIVRKISMPVYNATSKFSIENLVQIWSRREAWKQVQRRMIKKKGKSILPEDTKSFWLISFSEMMAQQAHNHSM